MCSHMKSELLFRSNLLLVFDLDYKVLFPFNYLLVYFTAFLCSCLRECVRSSPFTQNGTHPNNWWQIRSRWREVPLPAELHCSSPCWGSHLWLSGQAEVLVTVADFRGLLWNAEIIHTSKWLLDPCMEAKCEVLNKIFEKRTGKLFSSDIFGLNLGW